MKTVEREVLLGFWKVHILHHAGEGPVHGMWVLTELRRHGYEISPGTLYPLLNRMERNGWLKSSRDPKGGLRTRRSYRLTALGRKVLKLIVGQLKELHREVVAEETLRKFQAQSSKLKISSKTQVPKRQIGGTQQLGRVIDGRLNRE
jgi:PadR family transcriptional regulator PadR